MRILHTIDTTGPGGAEKLILELARATRKRGHESHVALVGEGWLCDRFREAGFDPVILPGLNTRWSYKYLVSLVTELRRRQIDIVHSHLFGAAVYCSVASRITGVPLVATLHGEVDLPEPSRLSRTKVRVMNTGARAHVFVSHVLEAALKRRFPFNSARARVIHNGIPIPTELPAVSTELRERLSIAPSARVVGALGNVRPAKGYDKLLDLVHFLRHKMGEDVVAVVAGDGDGNGLLGELLAKRHTLALDDAVHFLGYEADKYVFLRQLDAVVLTSSSEGLPFAPLEAMVAGTPVVAFGCGGVPEIIEDGVSGRLIAPGDVQAMAQALQAIFSDQQTRERIVTNGRRVVSERFSERVMVDQYFELYRELIEQTGKVSHHAA